MFRLIARYNRLPLSFISKGNPITFQFATFTKAAKKKIEAIKQVTSSTQNTLRKYIETCKDPKQLLGLRDRIFTQHQILMPLYLGRITPFLNPSFYQKHRNELQLINNELNNFSSQFQLTILQYLTQLEYRLICRELNPNYSNIVSFGFQRKIGVILSSLIHKRQVNLSQATYILQSLILLGSVHFTIYMNVAKYIKELLSQTPQKVTLQHIVTIINISMITRSEITIQKILYDLVFNHLMEKKGEEVRKKGINFKINILAGLLVTNFRNFYKSNRITKQNWVKELLNNVNQSLKKQSLQNLFDGKASKQSVNMLNWKHILNIADSIVFAIQNKVEIEYYHEDFDKCINIVYNLLISTIESSNPKNVSTNAYPYLIRIIFNRSIARLWLNQQKHKKSVYKYVSALNITQESVLYPFIDMINLLEQQNGSQFKQILEFAFNIFDNSNKNNVVIWGLAAKIVKHGTQKEGLNILKSVPQDNINHALLQDLYNHTHKIQTSHPSILDIYNKFSNKFQFFTSFHKGIKKFRDTKIILDSMFSIISTESFKKYMRELQTQIYFSEEKIQLLQILFITEVNSQGKSTQLINQLMKDSVIQHHILSECIVQNFPHPDRYARNAIFLSHPSNFKQSFETLIAKFDERKYSQFIWTTFLQNYIQLPYKYKSECYQLFEKVFLKAYQIKSIRKPILFATISGHIAGGVIVGDKTKLKALVQLCIDEIVNDIDYVSGYYYSCFLNIVVQTLSADLLSLQYFKKIIEYGKEKNYQMKLTSTLMLLYGAKLHHEAANNRYVLDESQKEMIQYQKSYLKAITFKHRWEAAGLSQSKVKTEDSFVFAGTTIACYAWFGLDQLRNLQKLIISFLKDSNNMIQICFIIRSFKRADLLNAKFVDKMLFETRDILIQKLQKYQKLQLLSKDQTMELISYIQN